jgi:hypothetical protein
MHGGDEKQMSPLWKWLLLSLSMKNKHQFNIFIYTEVCSHYHTVKIKTIRNYNFSDIAYKERDH